MFNKTTLAIVMISSLLTTAALAEPPMHDHQGHNMMHQDSQKGHRKCDPQFMTLVMIADADKNGALNKNELKDFQAKAKEYIAAKRKALVDFSEADLDKHGYVTLEEHAKLSPEPIYAPMPVENKANNKGNDTQMGKHHKKGPHNDGQMSNRPYDHMNEWKPYKNPAFGMMKKYDADADLRINKEEYAALYEQETKKINTCEEAFTSLNNADFNGDGVVSLPEIHNSVERVHLKNARNFMIQPR